MRFWDFASPKMRGTMARAGSCAHERQHMTREQAIIAVPDTAEDLVVRNLIEALNRIHADLERIEVWTAALACFSRGGSAIPAELRSSVAAAQAGSAFVLI